ncbi:TMV resistance protein N-like [Abrus precatorius]|uniref:TMV resistance protein N-like n=1 Tax=Abrus precatorius TaxID=3816 RepID=A0A8B8LRP0_ABRPR|nr:TMV resistance protein N-like [Abrus precatorius]
MLGTASLSSSSFTYRSTYDVFLSSHIDTHHSFTRNLYKALFDRGIYTFIVDEELRVGGGIRPSLVKAIQESRIGIIVFSKNYAFSSFCLDELVKVIECSKEYYRLVWPVFYDVDPSDVKYQRGTYGEALAKHEQQFKENSDKVQGWRMALCQAASLPGWIFKPRDGYEDKFIGTIVKEVSNKINRIPLHVADYPVELEPRVREVCLLLDVGSNDGMHMVGIYGMGGIGKTTLARAVYNVTADKFEGSCYLDNVRENSAKHGLVHLQERLLSEICGEKDIRLKSVNQGISAIKHRLQDKRALLILDDVDKVEQLEALVGRYDWFGHGSRVIITTRDRHLLRSHEIENIYEVKLLNNVSALELLTWNAFKHGKVSSSCQDILNQAVTYASGHPLALEVIGSNLFGKSVDEWRYALDKYKRITRNEIQMTLKVSYDALEDEEKSVFLDIACCFKGYELAQIEDVLCAHYGYHMKHHIKMLDEKSLIRITSDGRVALHPLIEDMGKEIVRQESRREPGRRSRLWFFEDILDVLLENTGTSKIEIIHWDFSLLKVVEWDGMALEKMKNLKTLIIRNGHFSRGPKHLPDSLRVLEWWRYPSEDLPSDFNPRKLVICKLPYTRTMSPNLAKLLENLQRAPEVLQTSQRVPEISQGVPEVLQTSQMGVPEVSHMVSEVLQASQSIIDVSQTSKSAPEVSQMLVPEVLQTSTSALQAEMMWRLVGLVSSIVGLLCFALSPSFHRLIGQWNPFKFSLYALLSLVICATILFARQSSFSKKNVKLKAYLGFSVLMVMSVYSYFYDRAVSGKPEIRSLVANAAFALMSLSLSKLIKFGFEMGIFCFFLGCFTIQLVTIDFKLISVAIIFGCPLFIMHSSSDYQPQVSNQGQDIYSSSDSRPEIVVEVNMP